MDLEKLKVGDKQTIKFNSNEEYINYKCNNENSIEGDLNLEDGVLCNDCLNRGFINVVENGTIVAKECKCMNQRRSAKRLKKSGITSSMLQMFTFGNYLTAKEWMKQAKSIVLDYCANIINEPLWLYVSGITGAGKTHLCVAAFQKTVKSGRFKNAEYMNWNEDAVNIISMSKSYDQTKYEERLKTLQEADLLYIDDFLKLTYSKNPEEYLSLAFRILDYRYRNNLPTIISSEIKLSVLSKMDSAIAGRINQKTLNGKYAVCLGNDEDRNYRMR